MHLPAGKDLFRANCFAQAPLCDLRCLIKDRGPVSFRPGRGLKIVYELAKALDGRFDQRFASGGSTSILVFPSSNEPHVAADTRIRARSRKRVGALRVESTADNRHNYREDSQAQWRRIFA